MKTQATVIIDGLPPKMRRPDFWAKILSIIMDLLAFGALSITSEVQAWPFIVGFGFMVIPHISRFRFRTLWMVTGFLLQVFLAFLLATRLQMAPIVAAAHVAPIALSWIGLTRGSEDLWGWKMGLGFISLILASALSPDFSVILFIISFIIAGAAALSCRFLADEFIRRGSVGTLPVGFMRMSLSQSGLLFLIALVIFPLIPRMEGRGMGQGNDPAKTGYTEDINLNEWSTVSGRGSNEAALRIYGPDGTDPSAYIYGGLLRSRVLDILGENRWDPSTVKIDTKSFSSAKTLALPSLMVVREMVGSANLPAPYGTRAANIELYGYRWNAEKTMFSEWREGRSRNQRFNYYLAIDKEEDTLPIDKPTQINLSVPEKFRTRRMNNLAESLFRGITKPQAKIRALQAHFLKEKFKAAYAEDAPPESEEGRNKLPPIERFLFIERNGHCELFASSYAILLRMGGIPTRLIAGFRVTRSSIGDVLTVRQSDAHAWIEAYLPDQGRWIPIDPTPRILHTLAFTDWLRDSYEWASAKWTQYILNYGAEEGSLRQKWEATKKFARNLAEGKNPLKSGDSDTNLYFFVTLFIGTAALLSFFGIVLIRKIKGRKASFVLDAARIALMAERARVNSLQTKVRILASQEKTYERSRALDREINQWLEKYYPLRFGAEDASRTLGVRELRSLRRKIEREIKDFP